MKTLTAKQEFNFWDKVLKIPNGCWEWTGNTRNGYGQLKLNDTCYAAHQVAWFLHIGHWPVNWVLHKCDNKTCVNPNHLYDGTQSDNQIDHISRGSLSNNLKLRPQQVLEIRGLLDFGFLTQKEIAKRYGVKRSAISAINTGHSWSHVKG